MPDNSAFVIGSIIGNRPLTTARQFAELTNCHNELRRGSFVLWPAIAARANSRTYARNACTAPTLAKVSSERGREGRYFKGDGSIGSFLLKNETAAIRSVSRVSVDIGRASRKIMGGGFVSMLVIERNNCFHFFEWREAVGRPGKVGWPVKGTYF